tara:strand:- start:8538 stop:9728 length:1191 start_codon:yes stop_codon:yes gene_type:complete
MNKKNGQANTSQVIGIYLSISPNIGGSYQYCLSIIDAIENIKNKNIKFIFFIHDKKWKKILPPRFKIIELTRRLFAEKIINILKIIQLPISIHRFLCSIISKKIRIINNSRCSYVIFPSQEDECGNIKLKSITAIHDLMHRYENKFKEYNVKEFHKREVNFKRICKFSNKILVDSRLGKKHVIDSYNCKSKKLLILPFTAPRYLKLSKIQDIYKKYKLPKKKFIFYPAQFWEHKNHKNLIKAFNILQKKEKNIILVLAGKEKNNLENIKLIIKKYKLNKKIYILGYIDQIDIFTFYKKASVMSFVSFSGPTNIPPLEAMFLGCPLICSNVYGMAEQVGSGGLLINPKSPQDIADKVSKIFKDRQLNKKIIKNGFKQYSKFNNTKFNINFEKNLFLK